MLNRHAVLVNAGLQFVSRDVPLLQRTVADLRSSRSSSTVADLVDDAMDLQAGLLVTADMLYSG